MKPSEQPEQSTKATEESTRQNTPLKRDETGLKVRQVRFQIDNSLQ